MSLDIAQVASMRLDLSSEASALLHSIAEPQQNIKATVSNVARKLGWTYRRTRAIWYKEARRIDAYELDDLRREDARLGDHWLIARHAKN